MVYQETEEDDFAGNGKAYTDGIGKISCNLIDEIRTKFKEPRLCAIQIRYIGAKGVLAADPELPDGHIILRKSMVKFENDQYNLQKISILDYNKYRVGTLNRQIILLLKTLQISDDVFLDLQRKNFTDISNLDSSAFKYFDIDAIESQKVWRLTSGPEYYRHFYNASFQLEKEPFFLGIKYTVRRRAAFILTSKSNIVVEESARLMGVIDECGYLGENQVYCTVEFDSDPQKDQHDNKAPVTRVQVKGQVVVVKNPCLHPGDVRVLEAVPLSSFPPVQQKYFSALVNVLVFPKKGPRPVTADIAGSDLDGDQYFISWNKNLIPH